MVLLEVVLDESLGSFSIDQVLPRNVYFSLQVLDFHAGLPAEQLSLIHI